jgi:hypothetical protein
MSILNVILILKDPYGGIFSIVNEVLGSGDGVWLATLMPYVVQRKELG